MNKDSASGGYRPRAARKKNKTASMIFLGGVAFLVVICGILYNISSKQTASGPKQTIAEKIPAANEPAAADNSENAEPSGQEQTGSPDVTDSTPVPSEPSSGLAEPEIPAEADQGSAVDPDNSKNGTDEPKQENNGVQSAALSGQKAKLPTTYIIQEGDTLSTISMKFYHSKQHVNLLAEQNHIVFINDMNLGDTIKIPALPSDTGATTGKPADQIDYAKINLPVTYLVRSGDTLYHIAMQFYHSMDYVDLIAKQNKLGKTEDLKAGSSLVIPAIPVKNQSSGKNSTGQAASEHIVQQGETLSSISRKYYGSSGYVSAIVKYNHLADGDDVKVGDMLKIPPAPKHTGSSKQLG